MNKKSLLKIAKYILKLVFPIVGIICLINYWRAELIVDKIHYGLCMLAMLIMTINNDGGDNRIVTS